MGLAEEWLAARARKTAALKEFKDLQAKLSADLGGEPREVSFGGQQFVLKPVTGKTVEWDETAVIEKLTVPQRKRLTVVTLDKDALNAALKSKELDIKVFGPLRKITDKEPYVLATVKA